MWRFAERRVVTGTAGHEALQYTPIMARDENEVSAEPGLGGAV